MLALRDLLTRSNDISASPGNEDDGVGKRLLGLTGDISWRGGMSAEVQKGLP